MAYPKFKAIPSIYERAKTLSSIKNTCEYLDKINTILNKYIPEKYVSFCHFGAIDEEKDIAILFINEQAIFHILRTMSEHILRSLSSNGFYFNGILFKIKKHQANIDTSIRYKNLSPAYKDKLKKLANSIGKPDIVRDYIQPINDDEVDL